MLTSSLRSNTVGDENHHKIKNELEFKYPWYAAERSFKRQSCLCYQKQGGSC